MRLAPIIASVLLFCSPLSLFGFPAQFGVSPDNATELLLSTIRSAKENLLVNIYQFDNFTIAQALQRKIGEGVTVEILVEGTPVGQISGDGKRVLQQLQAAMEAARNPQNRLWMMTGEKNNGKRRFRWNHAKYGVVDQERVFVSSENFSSSGHPRAGQVGNRGWDVVVENRALADEMTRLFREDANPKENDILQMWPRGASFPMPPPRFSRSRGWPIESVRSIPPLPPGQGEVQNVRVVTAPDALLSFQKFIRTAKTRLETEQMSLPSVWRDLEQRSRRSPFVSELVEAASRGVRVRVLVNDERVFSSHVSGEEGTLAPPKPKPNAVTVQFLRDMVRCYQLPIEAEMVDIKKVQITYIHNKGILVDGARALVSSINGTQNSMTANREVALWLESEAAATYYGQAFDFDWEQSKGMRLDGGGSEGMARDCPPRHEVTPFVWGDFLGHTASG